MESNGAVCLVILLGLITICSSDPLSDDDIDLLIDKFKEWGCDATPIDVILEGTVQGDRWTRVFDFKFMAEDGQKCTGMVYMTTNGGDRHSWECDSKPWKGEDEDGASESDGDSDEGKMKSTKRRRQGKKSKTKTKKKKKIKKYKKKGSAKNRVKGG